MKFSPKKIPSTPLIDNKFLTKAFWVSSLLVISYGPLFYTFFPGRNLIELGFGVTSV